MEPNRPTVLVADRSPIGRAWSARLLAEAGLTALTAHDGAEALTLARTGSPDVIVVSEMMAGMSGCDVVAALRREGGTSGIVLIAARGDDEAATDALRLGADEALVKPCHERALAASVTRAASAARARRARLVRDQRLDGELQAASAIQAALLPDAGSAPMGYTLDWAFLPAREVGGDLLDLVELPGGGLAMMLADVSGKGLGAALLSGMARTAFRAALARGEDPGRCLTATGRLLYPDLERTGAFLTAALVVLDPTSGTLLYADAGHGHHMIVGPDGAVRPLVEGGMPLGISPAADYTAGEETLSPGERLVVFSDGLVSAGWPIGYARGQLANLIQGGSSAADVVAATPDDDDRTLLVLGRSR
jgi:sigma-B regulation protein RsbU (phosphoserine phosphatase)